MTQIIDGQCFLDAICPTLVGGDAGDLAQVVKRRWTPAQLCPLLHHASVNVRRSAALVIGFVGDASVVGCLTQALSDADEQVNQMAEHALWSVWFRLGSPRTTQAFRAGVAHMDEENYDKALTCFDQALAIDPEFAEAYNQRAMTSFMLNQWGEAIEDCRKAIRLMPSHFGAIVLMGHCHVQLGDLERARLCYRRALRINPRLTDIAKAVAGIEASFQNPNDSSGIYAFDRTSF